MSHYEEKTAKLVSMGFQKSSSQRAIMESGGNLEVAVNSLLSLGTVDDTQCEEKQRAVPDSSGHARGRGIETTIQCELSQYNVPDGRSACTCIALNAAQDFLLSVSTISTSSLSSSAKSKCIIQEKFSPEFLQNMILSGVSVYNQVKSSHEGLEHLSAEEVLNTVSFPSLVLKGSIRQGVLSRNDDLGLMSQLRACREEGDCMKWTAVIISKTPETVCVCIPPTMPKLLPYILIDSHPRPNQLHINGSYMKFHDTIEDLVNTLYLLFPCTDLGPGVSDVMAMMYNSFDLYALQLREN